MKVNLIDQNAMDLFTVAESALLEGVRAGLGESLRVSPVARPFPELLRVFVSLSNLWGGVCDVIDTTKAEVTANARRVDALARAKGISCGASLMAALLDSSARDLTWRRASRWQRLRWAWRGIIPQEINADEDDD